MTPKTAAGALAAALLIAGCGGSDRQGTGALVWVNAPRVLRPPTLPRDRIAFGQVRNDSLRRITLESRDLRLVDARGRQVVGSAIFLRSFVHGLEPRNRASPRATEFERRRTGVLLKLDPGRSAPLTVSWRLGADGRAPDRVTYGSGELPLPKQ